MSISKNLARGDEIFSFPLNCFAWFCCQLLLIDTVYCHMGDEWPAMTDLTTVDADNSFLNDAFMDAVLSGNKRKAKSLIKKGIFDVF